MPDEIIAINRNEDPEPLQLTAMKVAMLNVFEQLREVIQEQATTLAVTEAESKGETRINPHRRDEFARQMLSMAAGVLGEKVVHLYQLQDEYLEYHLEIPAIS